MRSRRSLLLLGVFVFIVALVISVPARVAIALIAQPGIAVSGVSGSVWSGAAEEASVAGIYLRDIKWEASFLPLLTGKLAYRIEATPMSGFVETDLRIGFDRTLYLTNFTAAMPLQVLAGVQNAQALGGNASARFERIEIVDDLAVVADGVIQVADLVIPEVARESLGSYRADFNTQNNGIVASIEDTDGVLDLAGSLQIRTDRTYQFLAQVILTAKTPATVRQQLQRLPPPNARGQYELREEGQF